MIPRAFFITSGTGIASERDVAFDLALQNAGIGECNLVTVSSILPPDAEEVSKAVSRAPGEITFCVMSRMDGASGELIGAGVGYAWLVTRNNRAFGIICEHHGHHTAEYLEDKIRTKLAQMADTRGLELELKRIEVKTAVVGEGKFGSVVVALVFI